MLMFLASGAFRVDCFAFISKTAIPFEEWGGTSNRDQKAPQPDEPNNERNSFGRHQNSGVNSSVTISFGACRWILASQCRGIASSKFKFFDEI